MSLNNKPPADVLQLWEEVVDGLSKHEKVSWTKAVESLQYAENLFRTSSEAREFIDKYMVQLISIVIAQYSEIIDKKEREIVERTFTWSLQIIKEDLEATDHESGECVTLSALGPLFGEENSELKGRMVLVFRSIHGFSALASYMNARVSSSKFPPLDLIIVILEVVRKSIYSPISKGLAINLYSSNEDEDRGKVQKLHDIRDESIQISKAVMNHVIGLDEEYLQKIDLDTLRKIRWHLFRLYLRLSESDSQLMPSFFVFWRALALKLVTAQSPSLKLYGWDKIVDIVHDSKNMFLYPPRSYIVSGAGKSFINGRYEFAPQAKLMDNGQLKPSTAPIYNRRIHADDLNNKERAGKTLTLFKCSVRAQHKWWYLSEADKKQPGTERDIDYYQHKSKPNEDELPPCFGWLTMAAGEDPAPTLRPVCLDVPANAEQDILEKELASWAIENRVIELVFADPINSKVVAKSTEFIKFLVTRLCVQQDSDSAHMSEDVIMLNQFFLKAWKTCYDTKDSELSAQIYQLLVSVVPILPDEMAVNLFQTILDSLIRSDTCENDYVSGFCRNIDVLTDINKDNTTLVELARQIKMLVS